MPVCQTPPADFLVPAATTPWERMPAYPYRMTAAGCSEPEALLLEDTGPMLLDDGMPLLIRVYGVIQYRPGRAV